MLLIAEINVAYCGNQCCLLRKSMLLIAETKSPKKLVFMSFFGLDFLTENIYLKYILKYILNQSINQEKLLTDF